MGAVPAGRLLRMLCTAGLQRATDTAKMLCLNPGRPAPPDISG